MATRTCKSCGHEFQEWVEHCPSCAEPMEDYSRPAGFWIRFGAQIIDGLVFIPIVVLTFYNMYRFKSTVLLVAITLPGLVYKPLMESFYGATLGKMSCGIKVIDDNCNKISLTRAYIRFLLSREEGFFVAQVWPSSTGLRYGRRRAGGHADV